MILGDQSPLIDNLYPARGVINSVRKRCPSSMVIVPLVKDTSTTAGGSLMAISAVNHTIPNWCELLDLVVLLVTQCVINRPDNSAILPDALGYEVTSPTRMSYWDMTCVTCKPLYTTLLKQSRYIPAMCKLISFLAFENPRFSAMIAEVIWEELSNVTIETMYDAFEVLATFLLIKDNLKADRFSTFFAWNPVNNEGISIAKSVNNNVLNLQVMNCSRNMLNMMSNYRFQAVKSQALIAFIRSFLGIIDLLVGLSNANVPISGSSSSSPGNLLTEMLTNPMPHVVSWAGWMLQFLNQQLTTMKTQQSASGPVATGPFLVVYGEPSADRELSWIVRCEKTCQLLSGVLIKWGWQPMQVLEQFISLHTPVNNNAQTQQTVAAQHHATNNNTTMVTKTSPAVVELKDGMTDEELARFLASQDADLD
jgi:hypothetical protein